MLHKTVNYKFKKTTPLKDEIAVLARTAPVSMSAMDFKIARRVNTLK